MSDIITKELQSLVERLLYSLGRTTHHSGDSIVMELYLQQIASHIKQTLETLHRCGYGKKLLGFSPHMASYGTYPRGMLKYTTTVWYFYRQDADLYY